MEYMGYNYVVRRKNHEPGNTYYVCVNVNNDSKPCYAMGKMMENNTFQLYHPHNHQSPKPKKPEPKFMLKLKEFKNELKVRSINDLRSLKGIYASAAMSYPESADIFPWILAKSYMMPIRNVALMKQPDTLAHLEYMIANNQLCCSLIQKETFRGNVRTNDDSVTAVFADQSIINTVLQYGPREMHVDISSTFIPLKPNVKQLLTIHFLMEHLNIPLIYCLMEDDETYSYEAVFSFIRDNILIGYQPKLIITNFDPSLICAISKYFFPEKIYSSWYSYKQAIWNAFIEFDYLNLISTNHHAFICMTMLMALPLLPSSKIEQGFYAIKVYMEKFNVPIISVLTYYERIWLNHVGCDTISVDDSPLRTNDNIELFHTKLMKKFRKSLDVWDLLGFLEMCSNWNLLKESEKKYYICYKYAYDDGKIENNIDRLEDNLISIEKFLILCSVDLFSFWNQQLKWTHRFKTVGNLEINNDLYWDLNIFDSELHDTGLLKIDQTPFVIEDDNSENDRDNEGDDTSENDRDNEGDDISENDVEGDDTSETDVEGDDNNESEGGRIIVVDQQECMKYQSSSFAISNKGRGKNHQFPTVDGVPLNEYETESTTESEDNSNNFSCYYNSENKKSTLVETNKQCWDKDTGNNELQDKDRTSSTKCKSRSSKRR